MGKLEFKRASFDAQGAYNQACQDLLDAIDLEQILDALARGLWLKNHQTEPPQRAIPSDKDLCDLLERDDTLRHKVEGEGKKILNFFLSQPQTPPPLEKNKKPIRSDSDGRQHIELNVHFRWESGHAYVIMFLGCIKHPDAYGDAFEFGHRAWIETRKLGYKGNHPLAPVMTAWQNRPTEIEPFVPRQKAQLTLFDRIKKKKHGV